MKKTLRDIFESLIIFVLIFFMTVINPFSSIDYMLKDLLYQIPRGVSTQIKIIAIDEKTLEELGPINTWSRQYYADLIYMLNSYDDAKPAVIGFDILFSGYFGENATVSEGDVAFAKAAGESGNVVVVSQLQYEEKYETNAEGLTEFPIKHIIISIKRSTNS